MADYTIRLGRIMPYTAVDGVYHENAFWCMNNLTIDVMHNLLKIEFAAFSSKEKYNDGALPIYQATKCYEVQGFEQFHDIVDLPVALPFGTATPIAASILIMAWQIALETLEGVPNDTINEPDTRVSFFDGSVDANTPPDPEPIID